jgi:serine/threonine protein phosphatase PrpC
VPDIPPLPDALQTGDTLVLFMDRLWCLVRESELGRVAQSNPPQQACKELVNLALERGGPDNITVLVLRISV